MKLPWVSRVLFEEACARADAEHENAQLLRRDLVAREAKAEAKYADLLARYHMLRLQGAVDVVPVAPAPRVDPVTAAIARAAGGDPELRAMMEAQAVADRQRGKSDGDIISAIYLGQSATDGTFI